MPIGIRPINDFVFKKIFGTPENRAVLISLLNAILRLKLPIVAVTIENPFNLQDFHDDKLSVVDIKAVDASGAIYHIEMQLTTFDSLAWIPTVYHSPKELPTPRSDFAGIFSKSYSVMLN